MSMLPYDVHRRLEARPCACFPGACRGGEVIDGMLANGTRCKALEAGGAEVIDCTTLAAGRQVVEPCASWVDREALAAQKAREAIAADVAEASSQMIERFIVEPVKAREAPSLFDCGECPRLSGCLGRCMKAAIPRGQSC